MGRASVFAACPSAFVAVSDRLAAYTVSKLSPAVMLAVAVRRRAGARFGVDAHFARKARSDEPCEPPDHLGAVRFLQLLPVVMYSASGIAKVRGDWLSDPLVLWSHIHDSYQTADLVRPGAPSCPRR